MTRWRFGLAAALIAIAALPPLSWWWEASLVRHMLVQVPMLVVAGVLPGAVTVREHRPLQGAAAVLLALFGLMFWMMPRWLDAAVDSAAVDLAKFVTLVALVGVPLGWGWKRLGPVGRAFVWAQGVSMAGALGILYATFPERLCTSYLTGEQEVMGRLLLLAVAAFGLAGGLRALVGRPQERMGGAEQAARGALPPSRSPQDICGRMREAEGGCLAPCHVSPESGSCLGLKAGGPGTRVGPEERGPVRRCGSPPSRPTACSRAAPPS